MPPVGERPRGGSLAKRVAVAFALASILLLVFLEPRFRSSSRPTAARPAVETQAPARPHSLASDDEHCALPLPPPAAAASPIALTKKRTAAPAAGPDAPVQIVVRAEPWGGRILIERSSRIDRHRSGLLGEACGRLTANGEPKIEVAKQALRTVLLNTIPAGATVSFWIFSQVPKGQWPPLVNDPLVLEPERTISRLWNRRPGNPAQAQELIGRLDPFRPFLETPLVQAMYAAADADLKDAKGLKTLLVLTDGADTRFKVNRMFNPQQMSIPDFLKAHFNRFGARINLVFFTAALEKPEEVASARADFEVPLKSMDPPGSFVTAANRQELIGRWRKPSILPRSMSSWERTTGRPMEGCFP